MENAQETPEIIYAYTREQALEDGALIDVSETARELFKYPVALTQALYQTIEAIPAYASCEDVQGRLWDVLWMACKSGKLIHETTKEFSVLMSCYGAKRTLKLWAVCGPDDRGFPCVTIGYPQDF